MPPNAPSGRSARTPPSLNLQTNPTKDVEEMEETEAWEVDDDAGLKHRKPRQQAEKVTAPVLDQKGERQHLKVPGTPMLASKTSSKSKRSARQ